MDLTEFKNTVYPLKNKLFRFARKMVEQTEEAEDIVQDVFIRLWNRREKLDEYRSVEALAMVTVKNICIDRLRAKRYPVENMDDHGKFLENMAEENKPDNSDLIFGIRQAIKQLPESQQVIVHLRDIEGYEFQEIAETTGMNENAIRVALSRARQRIRDIMVNSKLYDIQRN